MKKAFTTLEMLISIFIIITFLPLITTLFHQLHRQQQIHHQLHQLYQLQLIMALSTQYQLIDPQTLQITYLNEEYELSFHQQRLVKRPGYQILFTKVQTGEFTEADDCLFLTINKQKMRLRCEKSLP